MSAQVSQPWEHTAEPGSAAVVEVSPLPPGGLRLVVSRGLGAAVVTVHGELDDRGRELLGLMLSDLIEGQGNRTVAVDLAHASAGPATAEVLTAAGCAAGRLGVRFIVKAPPREVVEALASREWGELIEIQAPWGAAMNQRADDARLSQGEAGPRRARRE